MIKVIENVSAQLFTKAVTCLPQDVISLLKKSYLAETNKIAKENLSLMIKNAEVAKKKNMIICQDTGMPFYFIFVGEEFPVSIMEIQEAIKNGCKKATEEFPLRPNIVDALTRKNTLTNTGDGIPVVNIEYIKNSSDLHIVMMPKGAGSENMSKVEFLLPSDGIEGIKKFILNTVISAGANPCPPTVLGVGIGGSADLCVKLAKKALLRKLGTHNKRQDIKSLEIELLRSINKSGIGPMGLGGKTTCLWINIETTQTHIAMLPVCVNVQCWVHRKASCKITKDGKVKYENI